jgi:cytochrome c oxidase subunit II
MSREMRHLRILLAGLALFAVVVTACNPLVGSGLFQTDYSSNGERIYFTGTSGHDRITFSGGDFGGMMGGGGMMGSQLACANCHGPDGRGRQFVMHMAEITAPDIRWSTLTKAEPGMDHPPYDEQTFKQAVTQGLDPAGHPLEAAMPHWQMSDQDLDDLIAFLKTLN